MKAHMWAGLLLVAAMISGLSDAIGHATSSRATLRLVPTQYTTIQAAINAAVLGDTVLVDEGTYYENIRFIGKHIVVGSQYVLDADTSHISRTIIDGSKPLNADSGSVVSFVNGEDTTSVLCGLTITGGTGTRYTPSFYGTYGKSGGGVYLRNAGARISHNVIAFNTVNPSGVTETYGGGISAWQDTIPFVIIEDNIIHHNSISSGSTQVAGGGIALATRARLVNNSITDNSLSSSSQFWNVFGGGVGATGSKIYAENNLIARNHVSSQRVGGGGGFYTFSIHSLHFRNNSVTDNVVESPLYAYGGGIEVLVTGEIPGWSQANILIESNLIAGNRSTGVDWSTGGGICAFGEKPLIQNNIIMKNTAYVGGGVGIIKDIFATPPVLINNTIAGNRATTGVGGGIASRGGWTPLVINSIAWADTGTSEIALLEGSGIGVYSSDIQGGYSGAGNINADPSFFSSHPDSLGWFHGNSPCANTGVTAVTVGSTVYTAPTRDYYNHFRPFGASVDIGAFEDGSWSGIEDIEGRMPAGYILHQNFPNPFNPATVVRFESPEVSDVRLVVYDLLGREAAVLVDGRKAPGRYEVTFDGSGFSSGVYICRLTAAQHTVSRQMILIK